MPEQFAADWLALREPADHAARNTSRVDEQLANLPAGRTLRIIDLGAGAGSNLRYLAPRLPAPQHWVLIDHDGDLLNRAKADAPLPGSALTIETLVHDLNQWPLPVADADLITASALLDLVSDPWLAELAQYCAARQLPTLLALNIDGRIQLSPTYPADDALLEAVNAHQRGEKDMGRALGPDAIERAIKHFSACGFRCETRASDWQLDAQHAPLQQELLSGWHAAACEQRPDMRTVFDDWLAERLKALPAGHILVGHQDFLALP